MGADQTSQRGPKHLFIPYLGRDSTAPFEKRPAMRSIPALVGLALLAGCSVIPGTEAHQEKLARTALQSTLADPASAQFADLRGPGAVGVDRLLCGRVNAKNSFGAYTGFQRFVANTREGGVLVEKNGPDAGFDHLWQDCENRA